tara:strand:- start:5141 stop:5389 length:249 start_codon:yes stop_codon:yes gene_type:complete
MELSYLNTNVSMLSDLREKYVNQLEQIKEIKETSKGHMKLVHQLQIDMTQNFIHDLTEIITTMRNNTTHLSNCVNIINNQLK